MGKDQVVFCLQQLAFRLDQVGFFKEEIDRIYQSQLIFFSGHLVRFGNGQVLFLAGQVFRPGGNNIGAGLFYGLTQLIFGVDFRKLGIGDAELCQADVGPDLFIPENGN